MINYFFSPRGKVFLEGDHKGDTGFLAPSNLLPKDVLKDDIFGVLVDYAVRIKVILGILYSDVNLDIPLIIARRPQVS